MGCDKLKPPDVPKLDPSKLPDGVSLPTGQDAQSFAAKAGKNATLSNAVKGAENLIDKNVKSVTNALNPEKIGEAIGGAIAGVANSITSAVDGAIAGVTGLVDSISNIGKKPLDKFSPESMIGSVKAKTGNLSLAALKQKKKCQEEYLKKAAEKTAAMKKKAEAKAAELTPKEKKAMAADPKEKERIEANMAKEVEEDMKAELIEEQKAKPAEEKSVQDALQAEKIIPTKKRASGTFDPHFTDMLLKQMSFYQMKMYECIRTIRTSMTSLVAEAGNLSPLDSIPAALYSIFVNATKFQVYARLSGGLTDEWRLYFGIKNSYSESSQGKDSATEGRLSTDLTPEDIYPTRDRVYVQQTKTTFEEYMKDLKGDLYSDNAKVQTHATDGKKQPGDVVLDWYFEMWMYGEHGTSPINEDYYGSWMHHFGNDRWYSDNNEKFKADQYELLNGKSATYRVSGKSHEESGLGNNYGLLSIDDSMYNIIPRSVGFEWYTEFENFISGTQSALNQRYGDDEGDLDDEMVNYIWGGDAWGRIGPTVLGAQEEIFQKLAHGDYMQTDHAPWSGFAGDKTSGDIVIGIDNNTGMDDQIYLPWFPVAANISWGDRGISRKRELLVRDIRFPVFNAEGTSVDSTDPAYVDLDRKYKANLYKNKTLSALDDTRQVFEGDEYGYYPYGIEKLAWGHDPVHDDVWPSSRGALGKAPLGRGSNPFD
jgi:hypothetical protein